MKIKVCFSGDGWPLDKQGKEGIIEIKSVDTSDGFNWHVDEHTFIISPVEELKQIQNSGLVSCLGVKPISMEIKF